MKYLQLIRKKLLPLLLSVAVIGSQVPVMAGEFDTEETKESIAAVSSGESEEEEKISESEVPEITEEADEIEAPSPDSDLELSEEGTAEEFSDSKDDTFGDGNSETDEEGIEYIKGRPLTEEEEQEQLEKVCRKLLELFAWKKESPSEIRFRLASSMLSLDKKEEAGVFCEKWYGQDKDDPVAATALIYARIADGKLKDAQKIVDRWLKKDEGYTEENAELLGAASFLQTVSGNVFA